MTNSYLTSPSPPSSLPYSSSTNCTLKSPLKIGVCNTHINGQYSYVQQFISEQSTLHPLSSYSTPSSSSSLILIIGIGTRFHRLTIVFKMSLFYISIFNVI